MNKLILVALISAVALAERDYEAMFKQFKSTHLKAYANEGEESKRFAAFVENMKKAEVLQAANPHATFGVNAFADVPASEFAVRLSAGKHYKRARAMPHKKLEVSLGEKVEAAGKSVDWRPSGFVTSVKDQGNCGSCWAFSAIGNIESVWAKNRNIKAVPLSEQELVSCDGNDGGCDGGMMDSAFQWLLDNTKGMVATEAAYPYKSGSGASYTNATQCQTLADLEVGAVVTGYSQLPDGDEDALTAVAGVSPVAVAVDASAFQSYKGGILTSCINRQINHGVLVVGYDDTSVPPYWIVKNSWGTSWGEQGYIRIVKGNNQCLITDYMVTATVPR